MNFHLRKFSYILSNDVTQLIILIFFTIGAAFVEDEKMTEDELLGLLRQLKEKEQ